MKKKILIVAANYYKHITKKLISGAIKKISKKNTYKIILVSGTFEIPFVISKNIQKYHGFIALGCVIKGQTPHFDFICNATFNALMKLSVDKKKPIGNGIITCLNMSQAKKRSTKKGEEASNAIFKLI